MEKKEKKQKILSVSVASYNLGEMIETNIKSFCESKVADDIELIITDDGSKDNTPDIAEKYVKLYPNTVKLIRKVNEGPGSTVNSGIKNATGKYFRMVDGDDWVETKNLEEYIELLKSSDADLVISDYDIFNNVDQKVMETITCDMEPLKEMAFEDVYKKIPYQMHALTFKTELFQKYNVVLDNCFYTDVEYVLFPMPNVKTVVYFNKTIYMYRVAQSAQSVSIPSMKKNIAQHERVFGNVLKFYDENKEKLEPANKKFIRNRIAIMADTQLGTYLLFDNCKERKDTIKKFVKDLKQNHIEVYKTFKTSKKCKMLVLSGYILYPMISKMYIKKLSKMA